MLRRALCLLFVFQSVASPVHAVDSWPAFRGPTANGHAGNGRLPVNWSDTQNVHWKTEIPGSGWSTPVVSEHRLFLTAAVPVADGDDLSLRLLGIDAFTGDIGLNVEVFRQVAAEAPGIHSKNSHASPSPIVDGNRVFVHFGHQGTACFDLSGELIWSNREFRYEPVHGNGGSPVLTGGHLIFSCDGKEQSYIVGLNKETGKLSWRTDRTTDASRKFSFSTPAVIEVAGQTQLISPGSNTVDALNPDTGKPIWSVRYDGYSVIPQPVFGHGLVFVCSGYDRPSLLAIRPTGQGDVTDTHVEWQDSRHIPHTPSVVLAGGELYMVSDKGIATCRDAKTGGLHWQNRLAGGFSASPILSGDKIYFLNEEGVATVVRCGKAYRELASNAIGEPTLASFAAVGNRLYVRGGRNLYCFSSD